MSCRLKGYEKCPDQEPIVEEIGYDPEADLENPTGSVFCAHGAGFVVNWDEVEAYMHLENTLESNEVSEEKKRPVVRQTRSTSSQIELTREELDAIYARTPDPVKKNRTPVMVRAKAQPAADDKWTARKEEKKEEYLLVDGYNIIYAWEDLKELADANLHAAQTKLMDILSNYQGFKKCTLILVFDAYKIEGHAEEVITYHNIHVVYTKEAETADQYIEKTVHKIGRENQVTVATSDGLEQIIIMGQGAHRMSARGLRDEIKATENQIRQQWHEKRQSSKNYLIDNISDEMAQYMKEKRLGKQ